MKEKLIKGTTLAVFFLLVIAFVAYRSGLWDGFKAIKTTGSHQNQSGDGPTTWPETSDTVLPMEVLPSSKSMVLKKPSADQLPEHVFGSDTHPKTNVPIPQSLSGLVAPSQKADTVSSNKTNPPSNKKP